jgi:hypothetical protein
MGAGGESMLKEVGSADGEPRLSERGLDFALLLAVLYTKPTHDTESLHGQRYWDWVRTQSYLSDIMT